MDGLRCARYRPWQIYQRGRSDKCFPSAANLATLADIWGSQRQFFASFSEAPIHPCSFSGGFVISRSRHNYKREQSAFFTNQRVLEVYPLSWLVDRFFFETVGVEYNTLSALADRAGAPPLLIIERKLSRVRNVALRFVHSRNQVQL